jgi:hypothetical protein
VQPNALARDLNRITVNDPDLTDDVCARRVGEARTQRQRESRSEDGGSPPSQRPTPPDCPNCVKLNAETRHRALSRAAILKVPSLGKIRLKRL